MSLTKVSYSMVNGAPFNVLDFGADATGVASSAGAFQAAVNAARTAGGGQIYVPTGTYLVDSKIDLYQGSIKSITIFGDGQQATNIKTLSDIVVFEHSSYCNFKDFSITQNGTAKTGRAFSTPTTVQAFYCNYENLYVSGFKYGIWWRYSVWNSVRSSTFAGNGVGIKMSRNAFPDDQTNPSSLGFWNIDGGFFQNQNTFDTVTIIGGEIGIFGSANGCLFNNVTCQNQDATGSANTVAPVGVPGTGIWLQNKGGTTSLFGAQSNVINAYYAEFTQQPLVFHYCTVSLSSFYIQGSGSIGSPYESGVNCLGATVDAASCVPAGSDYFKYQVVLDGGSTVYGNVSAGSATVTPTLLTVADRYLQNSIANQAKNVFFSVTGVSTTEITTMTPRFSYTVYVTGVYDGSSVRGAVFNVLHYQSGLTKILTATGSDSDITCTVSGNILRIGTTDSLAYDLYVTAVSNQTLGNQGVF